MEGLMVLGKGDFLHFSFKSDEKLKTIYIRMFSDDSEDEPEWYSMRGNTMNLLTGIDSSMYEQAYQDMLENAETFQNLDLLPDELRG